MIGKSSRSLLVIVLLSCAWLPSAAEEKESAFCGRTARESWSVCLRPDAEPIRLNSFQKWTVAIFDSSGQPIDRALVALDGGMQAHGHGLPTSPRVTEALGEGRYQIEGLKFTMTGEWFVVVEIQRGRKRDAARITLPIAADGNRSAAVDGWTPDELRILASLSVDKLPSRPADPSNRYLFNANAIELGRRLFHDSRLSGNGEISCASCHQPERYFTDGRSRSIGMRPMTRNAPTVVGASHGEWFYWDGRRDSLWSQALLPLEAPDEMGSSRWAIVRLVGAAPAYRRLFQRAFGRPPADVSETPAHAGPFAHGAALEFWQSLAPARRRAVDDAFANIGKSIAAYEATLQPPRARFDEFVDAMTSGDPKRANRWLDESERRGVRLFIAESSRCLQCHNGPMFSNGDFHNIGTGNFSGDSLDFGRSAGAQAVQIDPFNCLGPFSDAAPSQCESLRYLNASGHVPLEGAFKVPALRNVAATAPYMHDGSKSTLRAVIEHYRNPPKSDRAAHELEPLELTADQVDDLVAFLRSLSPRLIETAKPVPEQSR